MNSPSSLINPKELGMDSQTECIEILYLITLMSVYSEKDGTNIAVKGRARKLVLLTGIFKICARTLAR